MQSALFLEVTQRIAVIPRPTFRDNLFPILDLFTLEDGTDMFSRNVGKESPQYAG
jgi:hypothetical protein